MVIVDYLETVVDKEVDPAGALSVLREASEEGCKCGGAIADMRNRFEPAVA